MGFVVDVAVANKDLLQHLRSYRPWEILGVPQVGQDLIVAVKMGDSPRFFNLWQVTMVDVVDPDDGKDFRVETVLFGHGRPEIVTLNPWVTRPGLLLAQARHLEEGLAARKSPSRCLA